MVYDNSFMLSVKADVGTSTVEWHYNSVVITCSLCHNITFSTLMKMVEHMSNTRPPHGCDIHSIDLSLGVSTLQVLVLYIQG